MGLWENLEPYLYDHQPDLVESRVDFGFSCPDIEVEATGRGIIAVSASVMHGDDETLTLALFSQACFFRFAHLRETLHATA